MLGEKQANKKTTQKKKKKKDNDIALIHLPTDIPFLVSLHIILQSSDMPVCVVLFFTTYSLCSFLCFLLEITTYQVDKLSRKGKPNSSLGEPKYSILSIM